MRDRAGLSGAKVSFWRRVALGTLVRIEAFRLAPQRYLQGLGWRARGLKLRARHRLSELMGNAPHAYSLWIATREAQRHEALLADPIPDVPPSLVIVVDAREDASLLSDTLLSVATACDVARSKGWGDLPGVLVLGNAATPPSFAEDVQTVPCTQTLRRALSPRMDAYAPSGARPLVLTLKAGDQLAPVALLAYAAAIEADPTAGLFYADDDLLADGRHTPHFKPEWNAELARHHDFLTDSCVFRLDPLWSGPLWPEPARLVCARPRHVPYVLHHRRARLAPVIPAACPGSSTAPSNLPHVSIVVPTRNHCGLLRMCMEGIAATRYPSYDVTIIDNGSDEPETLAYLLELAQAGMRIVRDPGPFNYAAMHNRIVGQLAGPLICFLNNDIEMIRPDWLEIMAVAAGRSEVGAVGARLLYPDGTIQHAGIVTGVGGGAAHAHRFLAPGDEGYFARAHLPQFVSAVTAACLVVQKARFLEVGGFDEANFAVAFNDVDLCLKLTARGWKSLYEPRAVLIHHESKSRGTDHTPEKRARFAGELAALKRIWHTDHKTDPYHHAELSPFSEHFVVRL
ncbi:glycosyltransferase family 2 protein [Novosphingobium silvae]|uniref:glycosyltransferase family 2 protein n=1 Tax=Novosphingobium silvae TaxID=2692619 RepID=UPI001F1B5143|nr:glycosyltransferase family 2 protein [Novosphingobium silvae]